MRRIMLTAAALLITAACSRGAYDRFFTRGQHALASRQYADAAIDFENAARVSPESVDAQVGLAEAYAALGRHANAATAYERACEVAGSNDVACVRAAAERLTIGDFMTAASQARAILAADPLSLDAQLILGSALAGVRDFAAADERLEAALAQSPADWRVYKALGDMERARGNARVAEGWLTKAVDTDPSAPAPRVALATSYLETGRPVDGERQLQAALQANPDDADANRIYAGYLVANDRCDDAEPYWKRVAAQSTDGSGIIALADYYVWSGRPEAALDALRPLTKTRDEGGLARARIASILYDRHDRAGASEAVDAVLASDAQSVSALLLKARIALDGGDTAAGRALVHRAAALAPDSPGVRAMLAGLSER